MPVTFVPEFALCFQSYEAFETLSFKNTFPLVSTLLLIGVQNEYLPAFNLSVDADINT